MGIDPRRIDLIKGYYYLVPLWFVLENFFWPGVRAGLLVGDSELGRTAFYGVEGAIGAGFWLGSRWAAPAALLENATYLIYGFKYVLFGPLEIALSMETSRPLSAEHYIHSLPGVIWSMFLVVLQFYRAIGQFGRRES